MFYRYYCKRLLDFTFASIILFALSPLFIVLSIIIMISLGNPIIFRQIRPGLQEKLFTMYKFRTMTNDKNENDELLPDHIRLKKVGRLLRSTSLDELPELWNIIRGEMSFVGPRPLLVEYLPLYNEHQKRRHEVRPGLSGLAQVNGRNAISWEAKFDYDIQYVDSMGILVDLKIICHTLKKVFIREGINSDDSVTMEPFKGSM